jgi:hypothetical protein
MELVIVNPKPQDLTLSDPSLSDPSPFGSVPGEIADEVIRSEPPGTTVPAIASATEGPVRRVVWGPEANYLRLPD